jgi:hypothetical protein
MAPEIKSRRTTKRRGAKRTPSQSSDTASKRDKTGGSEKELLKLVPGGLANAFVNQKLHEKQLALAGLSGESKWEGDEPQIPDEIAGSDHDELSNLLGAFTNAYSTALYFSSKAYIEHGFYEQISEYLESLAILDSTESNDTKRKAEARTKAEVVAAKALQQSAYSDYVRFRDKAYALKMKHATVSRVGGFMSDEAEAEDTGALKRSSTRGKAAGAAKGRGRGSSRARSQR